MKTRRKQDDEIQGGISLHIHKTWLFFILTYRASPCTHTQNVPGYVIPTMRSLMPTLLSHTLLLGEERSSKGTSKLSSTTYEWMDANVKLGHRWERARTHIIRLCRNVLAHIIVSLKGKRKNDDKSLEEAAFYSSDLRCNFASLSVPGKKRMMVLCNVLFLNLV